MKKHMALKLNVPTIEDAASAQALQDTILTSEPDAKVNVDPNSKIVTVESQASEETFKQLIIAAGHKVA